MTPYPPDQYPGGPAEPQPAAAPGLAPGLPAGLQVLPVHGIGEVSAGDDLAGLIAGAAPWLRDGDVLVVTSKIVSKAEGRLLDVPADGPERDAARQQALAAETARVVAQRGPTTIVQTHHGFVMAAAGIDASNVEPTRLVLLPKDPDASARSLRATLRERHHVDVAVVVSDTMGRPWRNGLTDVALGAAGVPPIRDHRGEVDPYGNELQITEMAVIDELAAAGELVKGKRDRVPVAVVRGYLPARHGSRPAAEQPAGGPAGDGPGAAALIRVGAADMFSLGTDEARALGRRDVALLADDPDVLPGGPVQPGAVLRAIAAVAGVVAPDTGFTVEADPPAQPGAAAAVRCRPPAHAPATALIRFGADVHRLRAALAAEGLRSAVVPPGTAEPDPAQPDPGRPDAGACQVLLRISPA